MTKRTLVLLIGFALAVAPMRAEAGLASLLSKAGKLGKVGKVGRAVRVGGRAGRFAKVGSAAAGMTGALAAERAGLLFAGMGDDAARSAMYLARGADGELLRVTKAAGAERVSAGAVGESISGLGAAGERPSLFVDISAADAAPALAREHPSASLALVNGEQRLPLLRKAGGAAEDLVVETATGMVDLPDYLGEGDEDEEGSSVPFIAGAAILLFVGWLYFRRRASPTPA